MEQIKISVRKLVEFVWRSGSIDTRFSGFDRAQEGARIHRYIQKQGGKQYQPEVTLRTTRTVDGIDFLLEGRADGIIDRNGAYTVDEIKTTAAPAELLNEGYNFVHWAQAQCYAAMLCEEKSLCEISVQLTYFQIDSAKIIRLQKHFTQAEADAFLTDTLHRFCRWAAMQQSWLDARNAYLQACRFPFENYRPDQYRLAGAVYKTIAASERLMACAPTGIGKTISTLFPALKAMGENKAEKIFYLTAKTVTRRAAADALRQIACRNAQPYAVRSVVLTAKEHACLQDECSCTPETCPYADGYYDRVNDALFSVLEAQTDFSLDGILPFAREHKLCPFEFLLDIAQWCDVIVGDYNHLFDPLAQLQRFFAAEEPHDYVFLIDEAHNLPSRARDMYSAELDKKAALQIKKQLPKTDKKLIGALNKLNSAFLNCKRSAEQTVSVSAEQNEEICKAAQKLNTALKDWLQENKTHPLHGEILRFYFSVRFYLQISELYGENYVLLTTVTKSTVQCRQLCLNAAEFLSAAMSKGRSAVLFSATFTPTAYYKQLLGCTERTKTIMLRSPFPEENFCLLTADGISTRYQHRDATLPAVCNMIHAAVQVKKGNYIVFFPSYKYLNDAYEYTAQWEDVFCVKQETGMDDAQREAFLAQFSLQRENTLLAFCVMGGIFGEGIDLPGEQLIGCIVVGVGLPQICAEQDALRDYCDNEFSEGFAYAYQYPGMNKVQQAVGRVIRTHTDKGMALLIDDRYARADYKALFAPHWRARSVQTPLQAQNVLRDFWANTSKK